MSNIFENSFLNLIKDPEKKSNDQEENQAFLDPMTNSYPNKLLLTEKNPTIFPFENINLIFNKINYNPLSDEEEDEKFEIINYFQKSSKNTQEKKIVPNILKKKTNKTNSNDYNLVQNNLLNSSFSHKQLFVIKNKRKTARGRKIKNIRVKQFSHGANDFDNIQRKIQVHYFNFLIGLANDVINQFFLLKIKKDKSFKFKKVDYKIKKTVNQKHIEKLKEEKFSDILRKPISIKYKHSEKNSNQKILDSIIKINPWLAKFFDLNYLYILQNYYYNGGKPIKEIDFAGIKVILSDKTKNFIYLKRRFDLELQKTIEKTLKEVYFCGNNYNDKKYFTVI